MNAETILLIGKNCILTLVGTVSMMFGFVLWYVTYQGLWVYIDSYLKCLIVGLMWKYSERPFTYLCRPCLACMFKCYRGKWALDDKDVLMYTTNGTQRNISPKQPHAPLRLEVVPSNSAYSPRTPSTQSSSGATTPSSAK